MDAIEALDWAIKKAEQQADRCSRSGTFSQERVLRALIQSYKSKRHSLREEQGDKPCTS